MIFFFFFWSVKFGGFCQSLEVAIEHLSLSFVNLNL